MVTLNGAVVLDATGTRLSGAFSATYTAPDGTTTTVAPEVPVTGERETAG
jgi:hypothetical protein